MTLKGIRNCSLYQGITIRCVKDKKYHKTVPDLRVKNKRPQILES